MEADFAEAAVDFMVAADSAAAVDSVVAVDSAVVVGFVVAAAAAGSRIQARDLQKPSRGDVEVL
jgi:hypothetical protein